MKKKVIIARRIVVPYDFLSELAEVERCMPESEEEWVKVIKDVDVLIPYEQKITEGILNYAEKLGMIQTFGIGFDNVDVKAATKRGILVCNVQEVVSESVAQLAWAHILGLTRRIANADRGMRSGYFMQAGKWGATHDEDIVFYRSGPLLRGKTLGLVGLGNIGARVALKGFHAFNMRILVYDPYILSARARMFGAELVSLEYVLREADIVSIHCPLSKDTYHLIGKKELSMMKKSAFIINTSRGAIIDEDALIKCLQNQSIAGAGLDSYEKEPLPLDSPLLKLENTLLTPHNGSLLEELRQMHEEALANVVKFLKGERPRWIVNPMAVATSAT